jgi:hypothetical protein
MVSAKFLQHGREICFSFSCVCTVHDDGIEINCLIENCQFYVLPPSAEEWASRVAMQVKECTLFPGAHRGIRDLR